MRTELLRFNGAVERDPAIDAWMKEHAGELGAIAHQWFEVMRKCGDEVRELLHDGCPVACLGDAPFGYVNVFHSHVNVGFFHGAALPDPARLLQGTGKFMRHVKLTPGTATNATALSKLIDTAYSGRRRASKTVSSQNPSRGRRRCEPPNMSHIVPRGIKSESATLLRLARFVWGRFSDPNSHSI